jgi:hypothetical protein
LGSGNPAGRPKEQWREWLKSDRVEPVLQEQLLRIALDRRVKIETGVRVSQYLLDHAHGRAKEMVEVDNPGPGLPEMDIVMLQTMLEMRKQALAAKAPAPALSQGRNEKEKS